MTNSDAEGDDKRGYTSDWSRDDRKACDRFFKALQDDYLSDREQVEAELVDLIREKLREISEDG